MPLATLAPLTAIPGVRWYSLQVGPATGQIRSVTPPPPLIDFTADLHDFAQTAAMMSHLDLIITVDTAVAHLAGAMGKPAWVLLPDVPDWRWLLERTDSPWYPTLRLFRQERAGEWGPVIEAVRREIAAMLQRQSP